MYDISNRTIDLGGHTLKLAHFSMIFEGKNFIIENGNIEVKSTGNLDSYSLFIGDAGDSDNILIRNITAIGGINIFNAHNVVLENTKVEGRNFYAVWCDENAKVIIKSGEFSSNGVAVLGLVSAQYEAELKVQGGNFIANNKPLVLEQGDKYGKPVFSGGTSDVEIKSEYCAEGFKPIDNGNGQFTVGCAHKNTVWKNDEKTHWKECSDCKTILTDTQKEHYDNNGDNQCDECNYAIPKKEDDSDIKAPEPPKQDNTVEINKKDNTPNTGVTDYIYYAFPIAILSAIGIVITKNKKR